MRPNNIGDTPMLASNQGGNEGMSEQVRRLRQLHQAATEAHPTQEVSDRCDAVTMQNVNAHNHNQWVRRVSKARLDLLDPLGELLAALQHPVASSEGPTLGTFVNSLIDATKEAELLASEAPTADQQARPSVNATDDQELVGYDAAMSKDDQVVERVAKALHDTQRAAVLSAIGNDPARQAMRPAWESETAGIKSVYLDLARAAIEAAGISSLSNENGVLRELRDLRNIVLVAEDDVTVKHLRDLLGWQKIVARTTLGSTSHRGMENG